MPRSDTLGKLRRWLRVGMNDPVEFFDRLSIALKGRSDPSPPALGRENASIGRAPLAFKDLAALLGLSLEDPSRTPVSHEELEREWEDVWATLDYQAGHDADPALVRTIWLLCRHLRPSVVVETGVGRGVSTSIILRALERNGEGRLVSIDLPPLAEPWHSASAELVPDTLRHRWEYRRGSVRRELPRLLRALEQRNEPVDLYIGDSLHTAEHVQWEVETARSAMSPGALLVIDDVKSWIARYPETSGFTVLGHESKADAFAVIPA